jgi:hypothetical protein
VQDCGTGFFLCPYTLHTGWVNLGAFLAHTGWVKLSAFLPHMGWVNRGSFVDGVFWYTKHIHYTLVWICLWN